MIIDRAFKTSLNNQEKRLDEPKIRKPLAHTECSATEIGHVIYNSSEDPRRLAATQTSEQKENMT